jgi:hypothetical protein
MDTFSYLRNRNDVIRGINKKRPAIAFKIKISGALSVGDGQKSQSSPCCLLKIIILNAILAGLRDPINGKTKKNQIGFNELKPGAF